MSDYRAEFAISFTATDQDDAEMVAERVRAICETAARFYFDVQNVEEVR